ncbi:MAG: MFS transporter, partial [Ruthenibacterium sp.]
GSATSLVIGLIGYNVNTPTQTPAVQNSIWKAYTGIYVLGYVAAILILYFVYPLTKAKTAEMLQQLAEKRALAEAALEAEGKKES